MGARHREVVARSDGVAGTYLEVALHRLRADGERARTGWDDDTRECLIDGLHQEQTSNHQDARNR
jgi:hypothetical protein